MGQIVSIIIIVFGVLQIILFFKIWGMTNNISLINKKIKEHTYEYYMLIGDKEMAFKTLKEEMVSRLLNIKMETYSKDSFIQIANEEISNYIKLMEMTGFKIPLHLTSAEAFIAYKKEINLK